MPVPDMITAKMLPIVVYWIHRHVPFGKRCHKAQKTLTMKNYTLPGIEVHHLIAGAELAPFPTDATQGNIPDYTRWSMSMR